MINIRKYINKHGEDFIVRRGNESQNARGLEINEDEAPSFIRFEPGTDIQKGDVLYGKVSGNERTITHVENDIHNGKPFQLKGFFESPVPRRSSGIHVGSMVNSAIQQDSAGATQTLNISQNYREKATEVSEAISEILDRLNLSNNEYNDVSAELDTIKSQLRLTNAKPTLIRSSLQNIKSILETAAAAGGTLTLINDVLPQIVALLHLS